MFREILKAVVQAFGHDTTPLVELVRYGFFGEEFVTGRITRPDSHPIGVFQVRRYRGECPQSIVYLTLRTPHGIRKARFEVSEFPLPLEGIRSLQRTEEEVVEA